ETGAMLHEEENVWIDDKGEKHVVKGDAKFMSGDGEETEQEVKVSMEMEGDLAVATIETIKLKDGKKVKETQKIKGTEEEVKAEIEKRFGVPTPPKPPTTGTGDNQKQVEVKMEANEDGTAKATVTTTTTENGEVKVDEQLIEGTIEEVKAKVEALKDVDAKVNVKKKEVKIIEEKVMETGESDS
ncbi:MAG: hypothetical protein KJP09_06155, partial [Bacteroidia bacterium]|nr:hypothetical protein [Bacteroidia bacterium]